MQTVIFLPAMVVLNLAVDPLFDVLSKIMAILNHGPVLKLRVR